jgi:hypothetical protein
LPPFVVRAPASIRREARSGSFPSFESFMSVSSEYINIYLYHKKDVKKTPISPWGYFIRIVL